MLYFSTVLLKGSTTCQQIKMQRSMSSIPPTITINFWSLMIWRDKKRKKKKRGNSHEPWIDTCIALHREKKAANKKVF